MVTAKRIVQYGAVTDSQPPSSAVAWAAEAAGPGASARAVRRLTGGTHAATHLLRTERPTGEMVLRRFPPGDDAAAREAGVLAALDGLDGLAPRVVDVDPAGHRFGEPAILVTRLPGRADITSVSSQATAEQLGRVLARIHAMPLTRLTGLRDGMAAASASSPAGVDAGPTASVLAAHGHRLASQEPVLTHYDYWSGNVLWEQEMITGVVDWSGAAQAPRGLDVSWCRLDLTLLHGPDSAEIFLAAYEQAAAADVPDLALWDLFALGNSYRTVETWLPNYHDLGRTDLTAAHLRERHTIWIQECLARYRMD
ncbi:phosphotransferase [Micromonospora sp. DR5-3]|uniref:phosphotransferase family protein n=1 Tax=unclassified Micromonospora TaxID=2617518 RepID=UPI0011D83A7F|nr:MULTISPECIES: phosphotransferase [unclassified Micromonospora]MCW3819812.1 phosphotransferase [Micromonospora sp. DR5-3]TYC12761.1 phosphotransferase [Micromonospora sp. MP36]